MFKFLILSNLLTPSMLLKTFICVACTLDCCCFDRLHNLQPHFNLDSTVPLYLQFGTPAQFLPPQHNFIHLSNHLCSTPMQSLSLLPSPYCHHYLSSPRNLIASTCSKHSFNFTFLSPCHPNHLAFLQFTFISHLLNCNTLLITCWLWLSGVLQYSSKERKVMKN